MIKKALYVKKKKALHVSIYRPNSIYKLKKVSYMSPLNFHFICLLFEHVEKN